ncbi:helix-turn-helix transcriptional regulator [Amycolatopsis sp. NPDC005961]|uniref:helix-turn-helix domain-containing protein n=1 Tax=Amycolatopsis sp. NPDC005961 TaxID=3156720 RepID=UPI0033E0C8D5
MTEHVDDVNAEGVYDSGPDPNEVEFGQAIQRQRVRLRLSAVQAAKKAGLAYKTYLRVEAGMPVRGTTWSKLDRLFDLPDGTMFDAHARLDDLESLLGQAQFHASPLSMKGANTLGDTIRDQRKQLSDRELMISLITRLSPFTQDSRINDAVGILVKLAFSGSANDWVIFDEQGNVNVDKSPRFAGVEIDSEAGDAKHGKTSKR